MVRKANHAQNLLLGRELTDKLLKEGVESRYIYFLDARLAWLENDEPQKAIDIGSKYINKIHFGGGRAHLLNLLGCAHDAMEQYTEALECFTEASENDPETTFYFDNIAEIYDKMNENLKAYEWAREAKRRGSKTDVINKILKKNKV